MKKSLVLLIVAIMVVFAGCSSESADKNEIPEIADSISSMEIIIDNNLVKIKDKMTFNDFESMGFKLDENYDGILEANLAKGEEKSFNITTSKKKLVALSVKNNSNKECKVKEATVIFVGTYGGEEYDHSYVLPGKIKYNDSVKTITKAWGNPTLDLSVLEEGKLVQYVEKKYTFTANLNNKNQMTAFSFRID